MIPLSTLNFSEIIGKIIEFITNYGIGQGLLVLLVLAIMYFIYKRFESVHEQVLKGKDQEIDRLSKENEKYREMFMNFVVEKLNLEDFTKQQNTKEEKTLDLEAPPETIKPRSDKERQ